MTRLRPSAKAGLRRGRQMTEALDFGIVISDVGLKRRGKETEYIVGD